MIPKSVIPLLSVFVLVCTDDGQAGNIATILEPEFTTHEKSETEDEKVKIQLYYETLCPDCIDFSPLFMYTVVELQSYLDVHVYPFGNAKIEQNGSITCQHGPEECYGNKLHACAIDFIDNIILAVIFNDCMMDDGRGSDDDAADECGSLLNLDSESIKLCAKGPKGEELLKFYGEESMKVKYDDCPTVLINGVAGRTDHFRSDVCDSFQVPPTPCKR